MTNLPPNQKLAGFILGKPVDVWLRDKRAAGRSWRLLARDLYEATNGQIDITHETARKWSGETERASA